MPIRIRSRLPAGGRPAAVATSLLPVLALTAACGGGGGDGAKGSAKDPQRAVAAAALTKALLTSSDVPHVEVVPADSRTRMLGGAQTTDTPACRPVADQWSEQPLHPRQVYTGAIVTDTAAADKKAKTITLEVIASYKPGEAEAVLDELTTALRTCRTYRSTRNGATTTFSVRPAPSPGPVLGDQQITYTIADTARGAAGIVLVTVVRTGGATAAYETVRVDHATATLRAAIPLGQAARLKETAIGN